MKMFTSDQENLEKTFLDPMCKILENDQLRYMQSLELYVNQPLTLHHLSKLINTKDHHYSLVYKWGNDTRYPLYSDYHFINVNIDLFSDLIEPQQLAFNEKSVFVIDGITLLELDKHASLDILKLLKQKIILSKHTLLELYNWWNSLKSDKSKFSISLVQGKIVRFNNNAENLIVRVKRVIDFIEKEYDIVSVYGCDDETLINAYMVRDEFSAEDKASIHLCHEKNAILFTLDGRLRAWADKVFKINTIGIGELLRSLVIDGALNDKDYSSIMISQVMDNRYSLEWLNIPLYIEYMLISQENFQKVLFKLKDHISQQIEAEISLVGYMVEELDDVFMGKILPNGIEVIDLIKFWLTDEMFDRTKTLSLLQFRNYFYKKYGVTKFFKVDIRVC